MGQAERNKGATWVQALWHLSDLLAIGGGFLLGYWARFYSPLIRWIPPTKGIPPVSLYLLGAAVTALVWIPLLHGGGLYRLERTRPRHRALDLVRVQVFGMVVVAALSFFYRDATFSRLAVPLIWFFTVLLTILGRGVVQVWLRRSKLRPIRFAVVGSGPTAERLVESFRGASYPHEFVGCFSAGEEAGTGVAEGSGSMVEAAAMGARDVAVARNGGVPIVRDGDASLEPERVASPKRFLGPVARIREEGRRLDLDMIVLAAPSAPASLLQDVYAQCQELDLDFLFVPDLFSLWSRPVRVEDADGLPVIRLRDLPLAGWNGVLKRTFDLVVSALLLILLSPVFLILALAVKLDSRGPVFHTQERVGRDRRPFAIVKFRSMNVGAEDASGPVWAAAQDPRRTRLGTFLRRWSLDELPQLWNVLRGQMSLVGPRPERPFFVQRFETSVADYYDRHRVKSGITGWAQIHGLRGDTPIEERTRFDNFYVEHWSIWLDLRILLRTAAAVFKHQGN